MEQINKHYTEGEKSIFTHSGKVYQLDVLFKITHNRPIINIEVSKLSWVLKYTEVDSKRVLSANINIPVLVYDDPKYGLTVIDGAHRLTKATMDNVKTLPVIMVNESDMKLTEIKTLSIGNESAKEITWDPRFAPSYTPEEMLRLGVFEGKYINAVKGVPAQWKKISKVLGPDDKPDPTINRFGVKSRQPLSVWKKNGWIKTDKFGWFEWYINYFLNRRLGKEDDWQIGRWNSFVARHQGQIKADPKSKNKDARLKQKQALLNWGWNWEQSFTAEQKEKNAKRIARIAGVSLKEEDDNDKRIAQESLIVPNYIYW